MIEHTKGEWKYVEREDGIFGVEIPSAHSLYYDLECSCPECFGNMRLIAAAPDLLAALKALYEHTKNNYQICGINEQARAAIDKATT